MDSLQASTKSELEGWVPHVSNTGVNTTNPPLATTASQTDIASQGVTTYPNQTVTNQLQDNTMTNPNQITNPIQGLAAMTPNLNPVQDTITIPIQSRQPYQVSMQPNQVSSQLNQVSMQPNQVSMPDVDQVLQGRIQRLEAIVQELLEADRTTKLDRRKGSQVDVFLKEQQSLRRLSKRDEPIGKLNL